jgi:hypothetical protein
MPIYFNERGLRLADAPAPVAEPASKSQAEVPASTEVKQEQASKTEQMRMMDAVREAAREYDTPSEADIKEFVAGRAKDASKVDTQKFLDLTLEQRQNDLIDLLDNHLRSQGPLKRGRRKLRVSAPRGYLRRLLRSMDSDSIAQVSLRLRSIGHSDEEIDGFFQKKFGEEVMSQVASKKAQMSETDNWIADDLYFSEDDWDDLDSGYETNPTEMAQKIASNLPNPVINVTVQAPKNGKKIVKRDPITGLIESVEEEDEDAV